MERLGKYEIRGTLGRGAMGVVYEGWDPVISRRVAIKTVRLPDSTDSEENELHNRFKREAQAAGRLQHPNIVAVYDYAETDELAFIVMEFVDGRTLKSVLEADTPPGLEEAGRLMDGLLTGMEYSHRQGVIHRDIKPANVIITHSGAVKIADFGIARIESSTMTQAGDIMGTPAYMSPEQFKGEQIDARTDIYSAGVVLFQLLTQKQPYKGSMATIMLAVVNSPVPRPSEVARTVSPALDDVVMHAMARSPEERFPTAAAFNVALQEALRAPAAPAAGLGSGLGDLLGGEDATVVQPTRPPAGGPRTEVKRTDAARGAAARGAAAGGGAAGATAPAPAGKSKLPLVLAGVAGLVVIGGGAFWAMSGGSPATPLATPGTVTASLPPPARPAEQPALRTGPVADVTPSPTPTPTPLPTPLPAPTPAPQPSPLPLAAPTPLPLAAPTPLPQPAPTPQPVAAPTPQPAPGPTAQPAPTPAPQPAPTPRPQPTVAPVPQPQPAPTPQPVAAPAPQQAPIPAPIPAPPPPPIVTALVTPSPEAIRRAIAAAVQSASCTAVTGDERPGSAAVLRGVAGRGEGERALRTAFQEASPGAAVDWQVAAAEGPYCGVLDTVRPHLRPFAGPRGALSLAMADGRTDLKERDLVKPRATMPDFGAHLQLDYFASDGQMQHLRDSVPGTTLAALATPIFGEPRPNFKGWEVDNSVGTDLIVGVASSVPLFRTPRPEDETVAAYLPALAAAMDQAVRSGAKVSATVLMIRTNLGR